MALSPELRSLLMDPRQTGLLRSRAERVLREPITVFSEGDILVAWTPLIGRELARELLDGLAFHEKLDQEELAIIGELALIAEDCYRAWSAEVDTDVREWRQIAWSYTERRGTRSMLLHIGRWDGEVVEVRASSEGLGRLIRRLAEAQREFVARNGSIDREALQAARDLLDEAITFGLDEDGY